MNIIPETLHSLVFDDLNKGQLLLIVNAYIEHNNYVDFAQIGHKEWGFIPYNFEEYVYLNKSYANDYDLSDVKQFFEDNFYDLSTLENFFNEWTK